jgi:hypothetical protein
LAVAPAADTNEIPTLTRTFGEWNVTQAPQPALVALTQECCAPTTSFRHVPPASKFCENSAVKYKV